MMKALRWLPLSRRKAIKFVVSTSAGEVFPLVSLEEEGARLEIQDKQGILAVKIQMTSPDTLSIFIPVQKRKENVDELV